MNILAQSGCTTQDPLQTKSVDQRQSNLVLHEGDLRGRVNHRRPVTWLGEKPTSSQCQDILDTLVLDRLIVLKGFKKRIFFF